MQAEIAVTLLAASDFTGLSHRFVRVTGNNEIMLAAAGGLAVGVVNNRPRLGGAGRVGVGGLLHVTCGGSISAGDPVASDAQGRAVLAVGADQVLGTAAESGAIGEVIEFVMQVRGGASGTPSAPAALAVTPAARWHPEFSTVTESGGRVVSATDLQGLADVTEGGSGLGPEIVVDVAGATCWRFEGAQYLNVANTLVSTARDMAVVMVGRVHRVDAQNDFFSIGNEAAGTAENTIRSALGAEKPSSQGAPTLFGFRRFGGTGSGGTADMMVGSQISVMGVTSGTSSMRLNINGQTATPSDSANTAANVAGGEIGRYAAAPGTSGNWALMDLYELIVFDRELTGAEMDGVVAALQAHYGIIDVTNQLILEGDSITEGDDVPTGQTLGMVLTEPGSNRVPAGWRVVNMGQSGNTVSSLVGRRDFAQFPWVDQTLSGQNVLAVQIGRNNLSGGQAAATYAEFVAYLNTPTDGVLQAGWDVEVIINVATGNGTFQSDIETYRALLTTGSNNTPAPQFLTDVSANVGDAFDGQVSVIDAHLIEVGGDTTFLTSADAQDTTYYFPDFTHLNAAGVVALATGGDTPSRGIASGAS